MATSIYAKPIKAKTILKFTLPTVLMMVFMSLYTVVDGIVVANCVGSDALSAINIVYPFTLVFMAVGLMFSTGSNAIIAKKMGEGKQEEANRLMSGAAITATVISVIIAVLFTIFAEPMYMMFGSNEKILPYCIDYGSVMIPYGFVMCWQMLNQSYLVTADKPHIMLVFSILSGCTNIVLDILFMAVWDFGIIGAGLGTIIGMAVGAIPLLLFFNKKQTLHFGKPEFKVSEILFAMANPVPEIMPDVAKAAGARVVGTGRSDFPNQVNNVVAFPGIFKGALEGRATKITEEMKLAAANAIASLVPDDELSDDNIMPEAFNPKVAEVVAAAVKEHIVK